MAVKYIELAFKMPINPSETLVLVALADYADELGCCFPGYQSLMEKTKLSKSALSKTLFILEGAGFFEKKPHGSIGQGRKVNCYKLLFDESWFKEIVAETSKSTRRQLIDSIRLELIGKNQ